MVFLRCWHQDRPGSCRLSTVCIIQLTQNQCPVQAPGMSAPLVTPLEIVRTRSLASLVAQEIEQLILSGQIEPGERLNEQALAARLGVSRGPVREAVRG